MRGRVQLAIHSVRDCFVSSVDEYTYIVFFLINRNEVEENTSKKPTFDFFSFMRELTVLFLSINLTQYVILTCESLSHTSYLLMI